MKQRFGIVPWQASQVNQDVALLNKAENPGLFHNDFPHSLQQNSLKNSWQTLVHHFLIHCFLRLLQYRNTGYPQVSFLMFKTAILGKEQFLADPFEWGLKPQRMGNFSNELLGYHAAIAWLLVKVLSKFDPFPFIPTGNLQGYFYRYTVIYIYTHIYQPSNEMHMTVSSICGFHGMTNCCGYMAMSRYISNNIASHNLIYPQYILYPNLFFAILYFRYIPLYSYCILIKFVHHSHYIPGIQVHSEIIRICSQLYPMAYIQHIYFLNYIR